MAYDLKHLYKEEVVNFPEIIQYKSTHETPLNMYIFKPQLPESSHTYPAIVFFSYSGWEVFNATKLYPQSEYLASRGIVCINAEVRATKHGTSPEECVTDAKSAIRWIRSLSDLSRLRVNSEFIRGNSELSD